MNTLLAAETPVEEPPPLPDKTQYADYSNVSPDDIPELPPRVSVLNDTHRNKVGIHVIFFLGLAHDVDLVEFLVIPLYPDKMVNKIKSCAFITHSRFSKILAMETL